MQFTIARENFLKVLRRVSGVVERKNVQHPVLSNVLLKAQDNRLVVVATDTGVELTSITDDVDIAVDGEITVPFRKLNDICRALPDGSDIKLNLKGEKIQLLSGRSKFLLLTLPAEQFPSISVKTSVLNFNIAKEQLKTLLDRTAFSMADQDVRYFLNGMLFEVRDSKLFTVAADGHRLAMNFVPIDISKNKAIRVIFPRKGVLELLRTLDEAEDSVEISISINNISIFSKNFSLTSKLLEGKFPDYERVIPTSKDKVVFAGRDPLRSLLIRASALFTEKQRGVKVSLSEGNLKISANNAEQDEAEEDLEVDYTGENLNISFNARYLIEYLGITKSETVKIILKDANSGALLEDDTDGAYVLMPMRI